MNFQEIQTRMQSGETSASKLVAYYLERIQAIDRAGPTLNAIIEVNPDAQAIAAELDAERLKGQVRGPLHGIPIVLKDNMDTADRMTTTAGSLALAGHIAAQDAFLVQRLRQAGAVILAKANLSEWANFRSTHSVSGWSSRGGQTRNPYALDRSPCGSSSGSAVAVAADLCMAAVGTETDGSIVCPASTNGVVGIKPTLGLVSRSGIIPISHSQDTAGPMARCVADAAILLGAMAGVDPQDPATAGSAVNAALDFTSALQSDSLKDIRIGVARNFFGFHPQMDEVIEACIKVLADLGATLVDPADIKNSNRLEKHEMKVLVYDFKADLNAYLSRLGAQERVHSLDEVIAFNENEKERVMPYFAQEHMLAAQKKGPLTQEGYLKALAACRRLSRDEGIDATLQKHKLHAIVAPTAQPAWLMDYVNGDCGAGGCSTPPAVAGYPHITVPAGLLHGLPVGISFFGTAYSEATLIRLAYAFEQATQARREPQFLPTVVF